MTTGANESADRISRYRRVVRNHQRVNLNFPSDSIILMEYRLDVPWLVMEMADYNLRYFIYTKRKLYNREILGIFTLVSDLHKCGFTHNNLKPENVLYRSSWVLSDFDFSYTGDCDEDTLDHARRMDVYKMGEMLFEIETRMMYCDTVDLEKVVIERGKSHKDEEMIIRNILEIALSEDESYRYANATEFVNDLSFAFSGYSSMPTSRYMRHISRNNGQGLMRYSEEEYGRYFSLVKDISGYSNEKEKYVLGCREYEMIVAPSKDASKGLFESRECTADYFEEAAVLAKAGKYHLALRIIERLYMNYDRRTPLLKAASYYATGEGEMSRWMIIDGCRSAAEYGNVTAMRILAKLHALEDQTDESMEYSNKWFRKAADCGDEESAICLKSVGETSKSQPEHPIKTIDEEFRILLARDLDDWNAELQKSEPLRIPRGIRFNL